MPALPDVPKVLKIEFVHSYGTDTTVMSRQFWSYSGSAPNSDDLDTFCVNVGGGWDSNCASLSNAAQVALETVTAIDLSSSTGAEGTGAAAFPGTRDGADLDAATAMVVAYPISRRYRGGHPRGYWPFGSQPDLATPQTWSSGFVTEVADGIIGMNGNTAASGWGGAGILQQVSVSYYDGFVAVENPLTHRYRNVPTVRVTPLIDVVSTEVIPRTRVGSQRRRLGRS